MTAGDALKGKALLLFRRIFTDRRRPADGDVLDREGQMPQSYAAERAPTAFERELWARFWELANDPDMRELALEELRGLEERRDAQTAIVVFAGSAHTLVPLSDDLATSRNLLESVAGTPFQRDLSHAFARLEAALSPRMRQFLDRLPQVLAAKPGPRARGAATSPDIVARLLEATLHFRVALMRYDSVSSARVKDYVVHPYRLAFAQGGLLETLLGAETGDFAPVPAPVPDDR